MDLLLNANLSYLLLMMGILLGMMALLTPGTGILELGAVVALLVVAVQLFNIPINLWPLGLIGVGVLLYVLSIWRKGDVVLLSAGLILIFLGAALIYRGENGFLAVSPWLVLVVSIVEGTFLFIVSRKVVNAAWSPPLQDPGFLLGKTGETRTYVFDEGTVYAAGEEWSARSEQSIPPNTMVRILGKEGFTLIVEPLDSEPSADEK